METTDVVPPTLDRGGAGARRSSPTKTSRGVCRRSPRKLSRRCRPRARIPVRLYLKEIGKVPLLTAQQEVQIGRRIEVGQIALRRALAGIPMAVRALLDVGDRLRRGEMPADDVIVLPEGGELERQGRPPGAAGLRPRAAPRAQDRSPRGVARRTGAGPRPSRAGGAADDRRPAARRSRRSSRRCRSSRRSSTIWSARCAGIASRLNELADEVRRNRTAGGTRELKQLETGGGTAAQDAGRCCSSRSRRATARCARPSAS